MATKSWISISIETLANTLPMDKNSRRELEANVAAYIQSWMVANNIASVVTNVDPLLMGASPMMTETARQQLGKYESEGFLAVAKKGSEPLRYQPHRHKIDDAAAPSAEEQAAFDAQSEGENKVVPIDKNQPRPIEITENERNLLLAIRDSEYNDDSKLAAVWVNCLWGFEGQKKFGGVMASLAKKNLAQTDGECAWLTQIGLDRVKDEPYKCTIDRAKDAQGYVMSEEKPTSPELMKALGTLLKEDK